MSSFTSFLKLFKWDTKTDGSEKFNIDKALNENIDKIEANAKSVNDAIGSLSSLPTTDKTSLVNALKELYGNTFAKMKLNGNTYIEKTFDEVMNYNYSSIFTVHGADSVVKGSGFPSGAYSYGLLITLYSYANYAKTQIYIPDGPMKQGIYVRTRVGGNWLHLGGNVIAGTEFATSEYIDGKQVYRKRVNIGALPNATSKTVAHGLSNITFVRMQGAATNDAGTTMVLPHIAITLESMVGLSANNTNININTGMDRSNYAGYVDLYYTKNG